METPHQALPQTDAEHGQVSRELEPVNLIDERSIEALRERQLEAYSFAKKMGTDLGFPSDKVNGYAYGAVEGQVDIYLRNHSVKEDSDEYATYKNMLMDLSVISSYQSDWEPREGLEPGTSGKEKLATYRSRLTEDQKGESNETADANPEVESETLKLTTLRQTLATLSATRQGRLFGKGGEKYQQAQAAYNEQVIKLGRLKNKDIIEDEALDQTQKNAAVIEYLFEEQNALRHESLEQLRDKPVSRFIKKFSAYMNRGSKKVRLAKNLGLGLGIGLVAGVTGGLGAGFAVAAGAGAVTARLARAYAMAEAKEGRGMNQLANTEKQALATKLAEPSEDVAEGTDVFDRLQTAFNQTFEDEVSKEQKKRRKSVGKAAATVAIAGAVGSIGHAFLTGGDVFGFGAHDTHATSTPDADANAGGSSSAEPLLGDTNGDGVVDKLDFAPEQAAPVEILPDPHFFVGDGEGGIQLFESLGLDESNWYQVHQELLQNFPNDFYSMGEGQVGLAHPGQLSIEAQEFIKARFPQLGSLAR